VERKLKDEFPVFTHKTSDLWASLPAEMNEFEDSWQYLVTIFVIPGGTSRQLRLGVTPL